MYYDVKTIHAKNNVSGCVVRSEHRIDILNARSIRKKHLNVFITERFFKKTVYFLDSVKSFKRSHRRCSIEKLFSKFWGYSQKNTCVGVCFNKVK